MSQAYENYVEMKEAREKAGKCGGPAYGSHAAVWFDQVFGAGLSPSGKVDCPTPLRVGCTQNGLDALIIACPDNSNDLVVSAGATITVTMLQADSKNGPFEETGPTVCVKASDEGMIVGPDELVWRFPLGNFTKPWTKISLEFEGGFTGGLVTCALGYAPR